MSYDEDEIGEERGFRSDFDLDDDTAIPGEDDTPDFKFDDDEDDDPESRFH